MTQVKMGDSKLKPCILIPMTRKEIGDLDLLFATWSAYQEATQAECSRFDLVVTLSGQHCSETAGYITKSWEIFGLNHLFKSIDIKFLNISPHEDIYIKHGRTATYAKAIPRLGFKSGPNLQFFYSLAILRDYSHAFLHETDLFPLSKDWASALVEEMTRSRGAWVVGAQYTGKTILQPDIIGHVNGAAIYATGSEHFQDFCKNHWEPALESACRVDPDIAYDILWCKLKSWVQSGTISASAGLLQILAEVSQRFKTTRLIANMSTEHDGTLSFSDFQSLSQDEGACIVHNRSSGLNALLYALKSSNHKMLSALQLARLTRSLSNRPDVIELRRQLLTHKQPRCLVDLQMMRQGHKHTAETAREMKRTFSLCKASYTSEIVQMTNQDETKVHCFDKSNLGAIFKQLPDSWSSNSEADQKFTSEAGRNGDNCWNFLLHEELMQDSVLVKGHLEGYLCKGSYKNPVSEPETFYHILSFDPSSTRTSYAVASSLFTTEAGSFFLMVSSGQSHERAFIDITNYVCFSLTTPSRHLSTLIDKTMHILKETGMFLLDKAYPGCAEIWLSQQIRGIGLLPIANRPFLAVNDYSIAIAKAISSQIATCIFDPGFFTFLNFSNLQTTISSALFLGAGSKDYDNTNEIPSKDISVERLNDNLLRSRLLYFVPRSISSDQLTWKPLKMYAERAIDTTPEFLESHIQKLQLMPENPVMERLLGDIPATLRQKSSFFMLLDVACEKRKWVDQEEAYAWTIKEVAESAKNNEADQHVILFDGMTMADSRVDSYKSEMLAKLLLIIQTILEKAEYKNLPRNLAVLPLLPLEYSAKAVFYQRVNYFIAQVGTASLGVSKCFERFGRLIGPPHVLTKSSPAYQSLESSIMTDPSCSEVIDEDVGKPWDRQSYRILNYRDLIKADLAKSFGRNHE
jgi:hypothetical protein